MHALRDVSAPAKLNLFLHVVGRRSDGYHLLQSVFMLVDWHDTLHFEKRPYNERDGGLSREDLLAPLPADDLILRAARALQAATGYQGGAHIAIEKRLPAQAGLGGGSSDAASTLLALNRLWNLNLTRSQLKAIGLTLGADVPFFLGGRNAWVEGVGDILVPLPESLTRSSGMPRRLLIVKPAAGLDTRAIFADPGLKRDTPSATITGFAADPRSFWDWIGNEARNDLQPVAERLCPDVVQALSWLRSLGLAGRMTGSGSAVFARVESEFELPGPSAQMREPAGAEIKVCSSLEVHPLCDWADGE